MAIDNYSPKSNASFSGRRAWRSSLPHGMIQMSLDLAAPLQALLAGLMQIDD